MKNAALFLNGMPPARRMMEEAAQKRATDKDFRIYCTDGAYRYLSEVIVPDAVVGDFDSLSRDEVPHGVEIVPFSADKDFTDGFLAMKIMISRGFTDIDIFGGYGGRPDMAESNYFVLALASKAGIRARMRGDYTAYFVRHSFEMSVKKGITVSVVPFSDTLHILSMKGLKYPLTDYTMSRFDAVDAPDYVMGVSNEGTGARMELTLGQGIALVFIEE